MTSEALPSPRGWRIRIAALWASVGALLIAMLVLLYEYGRRVVVLNDAYRDPELQQADFDALNEQWVLAGLLTEIALPLAVGALLLAVIAVLTQARGWQLRRGLARSRRPDRPSH